MLTVDATPYYLGFANQNGTSGIATLPYLTRQFKVMGQYTTGANLVQLWGLPIRVAGVARAVPFAYGTTLKPSCLDWVWRRFNI